MHQHPRRSMLATLPQLSTMQAKHDFVVLKARFDIVLGIWLGVCPWNGADSVSTGHQSHSYSIQCSM